MDTGLFPAEHTSGVHAELRAQCHVVLPIAGPRQRRVATAVARIGRRQTAVGLQRLYILLRREGWQVGRKRVHRLYKPEGFQVRMRVRRRSASACTEGQCHSRLAVVSTGQWILFTTRWPTAGSSECLR